MKTKQVLLYLGLLIPSFIAATLLWQYCICGVFYYCSDSLPFELFSTGLFAHTEISGDYYVLPQGVIRLIQILFITGALTLPALLIWIYSRFLKHEFRKP